MHFCYTVNIKWMPREANYSVHLVRGVTAVEHWKEIKCFKYEQGLTYNYRNSIALKREKLFKLI